MSKPKNQSLQRRSTGAIARPSTNPMADLGPAVDQLPKKFPVFRLEYLADPEFTKQHPDFKAGKFSCSIGEQLDSLVVGLLAMKFSRICWPKTFDPTNITRIPLCKSDDGIAPTSGSEYPISNIQGMYKGKKQPLCVHVDENGIPIRDQTNRYVPACPNALWGPNGEPPACKEVFGLLVFEHTLNIPALFAVKATGIKHLSNLFGQFEMFKKQVKPQKGVPLKAMAKVEVIPLSKGRWYEPVFRITGTFSKTEIEMNLDAMKTYNIPFEQTEVEDFMDFNQNQED